MNRANSPSPRWLALGCATSRPPRPSAGRHCRLRGMRDFILGVRFVDGAGRVLRMGGKVVKNAAGFDVPKFFVGSLGRFGVLEEITVKVFPRPPASLTARLAAATLEAAQQILIEAANSRFEFD